MAAFTSTTPVHRMGAEDMVAATVRFANGAIGTFDVFYQDGRTEQVKGEDVIGGGADPMAYSHHAHKNLIVSFLEGLDAGREPEVSGESALRVHRLIDALARRQH